MAPTGGGNYRMHTRFARFQNVPEMLRMWHVFADVKHRRGPPAARPRARRAPRRAARPDTLLIAASPSCRLRRTQLGERAEKVRGGVVDPSEDNMLQDHRRRPQGRAGHAPRHRPAAPARPASSRSPPTRSPACTTQHPRAHLPRPRQRRAARPPPGRCRSCSATSPPPRRGVERLRASCATSSPPAASPPSRSGSSTRPATTPRRPGCSPPAAPGRSP